MSKKHKASNKKSTTQKQLEVEKKDPAVVEEVDDGEIELFDTPVKDEDLLDVDDEAVTSDEENVSETTENGVNDDESNKVATDDDRKKITLGQRLHALNVRLPWLKVVLLLILAFSAAAVTEETLRHSIKPPVIANGTVLETGGEIVDAPETEVGEGASEVVEAPATEVELEMKPEIKIDTSVIPIPYEQPDYTGKKLIALTFDDGPSAATTPRLLEILRDKKVKATFFVVGNMAQRAPNLLQAEVAGGHEIGSHTMTHRNLATATVADLRWEVEQVDAVFQQAVGMTPTIMRPPYGAISDTVRANLGQPMIIWTIDPEDWKYRDAALVRSKVVAAAFDGAIILTHDIHASTVDAIPGIIDDLRAQGYEFVTVSELAKVRGVKLENGVVYGSFRP